MRAPLGRLARALTAALLLAAPSGAAVVEAVRVEAPRVPVLAGVAGAGTLGAPALAPLAAPSVLAAPPSAPPAAPAPAAAWGHARAVAARLAAARGVAPEGHAYLYESLARYVYNGTGDAALAALADAPSDGPALPERWTAKLRRDLDAPYDDGQALARLDHLQTELEDCVRWLRARRPRGGFRLLLMGGLLRGRLSAHSDADLILLSDDADFLREALEGPFGYLSKGRDAVLGPMPQNPRLAAAMGETRDLGEGKAVLDSPDLLRRTFFRARAAASAAPMERDAPLDADLMARIKALGALLDRARDQAERLRLEGEIDALAAGLPAPAAPLSARPGRYVPVGDARVDLRAPGARAVLAVLGRADGRPVIGLYDLRRGAVLNAAPLGSPGVSGHKDLIPHRASARDYAGWTFLLSPDGSGRFAGSGAAPGDLTPRLRRAVLRHLGVRPAAFPSPGWRGLMARARRFWAAVRGR